MTPATPNDADAEEVGPFQFLVLVFSVLALAAISFDTFAPVPPEVGRILHAVDLIACGVLFVDFIVRFRAAESKLRFMRLGWIDLLACVPNIEALRFARVFRIFRVIVILQRIRSLRRLLAVLFTSRRRGGVASVIATTFVLVVCASIGILLFERAADSNIKTAGDAVWWSVTTITTVGYGDRFPVTSEGRIVAMILMLSGVGLFGALSGLVASLFLGRSREESQVVAELKTLHADLEHLRGLTPPPPTSRIETK